MELKNTRNKKIIKATREKRRDINEEEKEKNYNDKKMRRMKTGTMEERTPERLLTHTRLSAYINESPRLSVTVYTVGRLPFTHSRERLIQLPATRSQDEGKVDAI